MVECRHTKLTRMERDGQTPEYRCTDCGTVVVQSVERPAVRLVGQDGNAFAILGRVQNALRRNGATPAAVAKYGEEAISGDYDNLLRVTMEWVEVS